MAEPFRIYFVVKSASYKETLRNVFEGIAALGWSLDGVTCFQRPKTRVLPLVPRKFEVAENVPGSLEAVLGADAAVATFHSEGKWLDLSAGFHQAGRVELESDTTFFDPPSRLKEMGSLLSRLRFLEDTFIVGDLEHRLSSLESFLTPGDWRTWRTKFAGRVGRFGFLWLDHVPLSFMETLSAKLPSTGGEVLASVGEGSVVAVWDTPYNQQHRAELIFVARRIARG